MNNFFNRKKTITYFVICGIFVLAIIFRYGSLAMQPVSEVARNKETVERGAIVDRTGLPLAVSTNFYHVGISLKTLNNSRTTKESFARNICNALEMSENEIIGILNTQKSFVYLKKRISQSMFEELSQIIDDNNYNFVNFEKIPGRNYPNHSLASQLVGYMGDDGKGLAGIEFSQQEILQPENSNEQGKNVFLTIDANLQYKLEQIAQKTMEETQAESMMLIAADAKNGEILSYLSFPAADLNEYGNSSQESRIDRPAMEAYEPGSVFKIFTVGIVYDEHGISPNDTFYCDGQYEKRLSNGETIKIKCLEKHGQGTARDGLRFSCNDILGQISDKISEENFITRIRLLGFGQRTDVELPGETSGSVKEPYSKLWSARSKPTIAIGQEISVSALQMVQAATSIANGGLPVKLTLIKKITNKDGTSFYEHKPEYKTRAFSKATADYVLSCMETTATVGTGTRANLHDVSIGVKTGTAQMADKIKGGYSQTDFLSNCIAIFPVEDPQIVLYIVVEKAKGETYAGRIVAPVIAQAADVIIDHLGMSRSGTSSLSHNGVITIPSSQDIKVGSYVPDFIGKSKRELLPLLNRDDIKFNINGSGWVTSQNPQAGTKLSENMTIELYLE